MSCRILALAASIVLLSGCMWEGRPDGSAGVHTTLDGRYQDEGVEMGGPAFDTEAEVIEPLDGESAVVAPAPVDLTQPAPTTGTADATSEVEEALTPGTEQ